MMITEQRWDDCRQKRRKVRNKHTENKVSSARTCHGEKRRDAVIREKKKKRRENASVIITIEGPKKACRCKKKEIEK